ncbi:hypothetical protein BV22DRAFT_1042027 [Leucogyrophana mollusca]|uniref:Uncharacterized protein n=1 Tax=Leucogyrophana mollusca TaxID=85980 RepID=A0ACB8AYG2_9AGAM|nr:hypothetical protein BV22DRAFT_1042027 [Leucogyrophana mollusca]
MLPSCRPIDKRVEKEMRMHNRMHKVPIPEHGHRETRLSPMWHSDKLMWYVFHLHRPVFDLTLSSR